MTGRIGAARAMVRRFEPGISAAPAARDDARWSDAVPLTIALWLFVLLIFLPVIIERHAAEGWSSIALDGSTIIVSMLLALPLFALFRICIEWSTPRRVVLLSLGILLTAILQTAFDFFFTGWVAENLREAWVTLPRNLTRASGAMLNYVCVFTVNLALFQMSYLRRRSLRQERQLAAALAAAQQAQLAALRLQLNPHFLFNTLNAISAMIVTHRNADAEMMTDKLSSFLRASLAFEPTALVPLDDELELTRDYLGIEGIRFRDRMRVDISCTVETQRLLVPGLLIQPLVENAIKYGVARSIDPVTIAIVARREGDTLFISVADSGDDEASAQEPVGTGVGLDNLRKRLEALYGDAAGLTAGQSGRGFVAEVRLPAVLAVDGDL